MVTDVKALPSRPNLEQYKKQAKDLLKSFKAGDEDALRRIGTYHPRIRKERALPDPMTLSDTQWAVAREYGFESWPKFVKHIEALHSDSSVESKFERAADAISSGDLKTLKRLLKENPELIRARSTRVHGGTLLHYVGANGIEYYRQKTPKNAAAILKVLLDAGAEVNAEADMYRRDTTIGLVATSVHPVITGVQETLIEALLKAGASIDTDGSTVNACLANGRGAAAELLARHGASLDLEGAAGVGRLDLVRSFFDEDGRLDEATEEQMRSGFAWACEFGRTEVVDYLLDHGMKVGDRLRHNGQTGLHWAAFAGHGDTARLLLARGAAVDARDESFDGTPLGWALYGWSEGRKREAARYYEVASLLVAAGATVSVGEYEDAIRKDPQMKAALGLDRKRSAREKLIEGVSVVHPLEGAKAARFQAKTMLIPSPLQIRDAIAGIPYGQTKTTTEVREDLAREAGADVTCPRVFTIGWQIVAEAAEEDRADGVADVTPWWRVTKDGKPNPKLPRHLDLLRSEGYPK